MRPPSNRLTFAEADEGERPVGAGQRGPDVAVIGSDAGRGITLAVRRLDGFLGRAHPRLVALIIRPLRQRRAQSLILGQRR